MSDWTVIGRRRFTFDNPQPALYDRIAAVKALVGEFPVEGRLLFSNLGKFTKGMPKYVMMLDGIEVEFPPVDRRLKGSAALAQSEEVWSRLVAQLKPSPHLFTNLYRGRRAARRCGWSFPPAPPAIRRAAPPPLARCAAGTPARCAVISGAGSRSRGNR